MTDNHENENLVEYKHFIRETPKYVYRKKSVEVPEIVYKETPVVRLVEVPKIVEEVVIKEVKVPQYVEKPVPEYVTVECEQRVDRSVPVPVEAETTYELQMPSLKPQYKVVKYRVYLPRFIQVPLPEELLDEEVLGEAEYLAQQIRLLAEQEAPSLAEIEKLAEIAKQTDFQSHLRTENIQTAVSRVLPYQNVAA